MLPPTSTSIICALSHSPNILAATSFSPASPISISNLLYFWFLMPIFNFSFMRFFRFETTVSIFFLEVWDEDRVPGRGRRPRKVKKDTTGAVDVSADNLLRDFNICKWQSLAVIDSYLICIFQIFAKKTPPKKKCEINKYTNKYQQKIIDRKNWP